MTLRSGILSGYWLSPDDEVPPKRPEFKSNGALLIRHDTRLRGPFTALDLCHSMANTKFPWVALWHDRQQTLLHHRTLSTGPRFAVYPSTPGSPPLAVFRLERALPLSASDALSQYGRDDVLSGDKDVVVLDLSFLPELSPPNAPERFTVPRQEKPVAHSGGQLPPTIEDAAKSNGTPRVAADPPVPAPAQPLSLQDLLIARVRAVLDHADKHGSVSFSDSATDAGPLEALDSVVSRVERARAYAPPMPSADVTVDSIGMASKGSAEPYDLRTYDA